MSIVTYASQPVSPSGSPDACLRRPRAAHRAFRSTTHLSVETWLAAAAVELRGAGVYAPVRADPARYACALLFHRSTMLGGRQERVERRVVS